MKLNLFFIVLICLLPLMSACENTEDTAISGDEDADNLEDSEDESDGDVDNSEQSESVLYDEPDFRCINAECREGFTYSPGCLFPDETLINFGDDENECEENSDCGPVEVCLFTNPQYICVNKDVKEWVGLYRWSEECSWKKIADMESECAVVTVFEDNGKKVIIQQCYEESLARLCVDGVCSSIDSFDGYYLMALSNCDDKGTVLVFFNQYDYPYEYIAYRFTGNTLNEIGREEVNINYWLRDSYWSEITCNNEGQMIWMRPDSISIFKNGQFADLVDVDSLSDLSGYIYYGFSFDTVKFDVDDSSLLHIGAANWENSLRFKFDINNGLKDKEYVAVEEYYPRSIVTGDDLWLIGSHDSLYRKNVNEDEEYLFDLGDRENIIGLTKDNLLLTRSFSRIFKYKLIPESYPQAMDSGLPFALDYKYYVPSIRNAFLETHNGKDNATLYIQYRPTGENVK